MKHLIKHTILLTVCSMLFVNSCDHSILKDKAPPPQSQTQKDNVSAAKIDGLRPKILEGEYIVIFKNQFNGRFSQAIANQVEQLRTTILHSHNISQKAIIAKYSHSSKGFAAELTDEQLEALKKDPRIKNITPNVLFTLHSAITPAFSFFPVAEFNEKDLLVIGEKLPWSVARVNGPFDGTGEKAWILGTGIDLDHPDLNVDVANSKSFVDDDDYIGDEDPDDNIGHGTYVAGILAAKNNNQGIVGVAAGASVVAIKVCKIYYVPDPDVRCPLASIKDALEYVATKAQPDDIVNISLGVYDPNGDHMAVDNEIIDMANNGIRFVISAGNEAVFAGDVTPARIDHNNVWTVSAFRETNDEFAEDFNCPDNHQGSNYGNPPIDYSAGGEDVPSLLIGGSWDFGYGSSPDCADDGTSYAAPVIAGLLLATPADLAVWDYVTGDPDGNPDPIAINPPLTVYITGDALLKSGETGTWTATVQNNEGPIMYQWYKQPVNSNNWFPPLGGDHDSQYSTAFYNGTSSAQYAKIKVVVNSNGETANDFVWVGVSSEDCEDENAANNNSTTPSLLPPPCSW